MRQDRTNQRHSLREASYFRSPPAGNLMPGLKEWVIRFLGILAVVGVSVYPADPLTAQDECLQLPRLQWPLPGLEMNYDAALLPFSDAWCNHRISMPSLCQNNQSSCSPEGLLDPASACDFHNSGIHCWGGCGDQSESHRHVAIDIRDKADALDISQNVRGAIVGRRVFPVYAGVVKYVNKFGSPASEPWEWVVVVEHSFGSGCRFTSIYWHLNNVRVSPGDEVGGRDVLGEIADLVNDYVIPEFKLLDIDHLHLGLRAGGYVEDSTAYAGALSPSDFGLEGLPFLDPVAEDVQYDYYPFGDIRCGDKDIWYYGYAAALTEHGVLKGFNDGTFGGGVDVSKAEFLKMSLVGAKRISEITGSFDHWYDPYLEFALEEGLIDASVSFANPDDSIRRWEAAVLLVDIFDLWDYQGPVENLTDVNGELAYAGHVYQAFRADVMHGYGEGIFGPADKLLRSQAAKIICLAALGGATECSRECR